MNAATKTEITIVLEWRLDVVSARCESVDTIQGMMESAGLKVKGDLGGNQSLFKVMINRKTPSQRNKIYFGVIFMPSGFVGSNTRRRWRYGDDWLA
jgi:hypothetical protein